MSCREAVDVYVRVVLVRCRGNGSGRVVSGELCLIAHIWLALLETVDGWRTQREGCSRAGSVACRGIALLHSKWLTGGRKAEQRCGLHGTGSEKIKKPLLLGCNAI
jgi:hypothetical protein